ncbi:hypothetical protein LguiB_026348 [Lonicera macranthoides]
MVKIENMYQISIMPTSGLNFLMKFCRYGLPSPPSLVKKSIHLVLKLEPIG